MIDIVADSDAHCVQISANLMLLLFKELAKSNLVFVHN